MKYLALIILLLGSFEVYSCSCVGAPTIQEAFGKSKYVFHGVMIGSKMIDESESIGSFTFKIRDSYKGGKTGVVEIKTKIHSCTLTLVLGRRYILYMQGDEGIYLCGASKDAAYIEPGEWEFLRSKLST